MENVIDDELIKGHRVTLKSDGTFIVNGSIREWYKDARTGKTWIPKKRNSLMGLIKQSLDE